MFNVEVYHIIKLIKLAIAVCGINYERLVRHTVIIYGAASIRINLSYYVIYLFVRHLVSKSFQNPPGAENQRQ